jgi:hypothetical protein
MIVSFGEAIVVRGLLQLGKIMFKAQLIEKVEVVHLLR